MKVGGVGQHTITRMKYLKQLKKRKGLILALGVEVLAHDQLGLLLWVCFKAPNYVEDEGTEQLGIMEDRKLKRDRTYFFQAHINLKIEIPNCLNKN